MTKSTKLLKLFQIRFWGFRQISVAISEYMNFDMKQFDNFSDQILIFVLLISFQLETVIDKSRADPDANTGSGSLGTSGNGKSPSKVTLNETIWRVFCSNIFFCRKRKIYFKGDFFRRRSTSAGYVWTARER